MVEKQNQFYFGAYTFRCLSCIFEGYIYSHLTVFMRVMCARGKIQRNNYQHGLYFVC